MYITPILIFYCQNSLKNSIQRSNVLNFITSFKHAFLCSKAHIILRNKTL